MLAENLDLCNTLPILDVVGEAQLRLTCRIRRKFRNTLSSEKIVKVGERILTICTAVLTQKLSVTDIQTDRPANILRQQSLRYVQSVSRDNTNMQFALVFSHAHQLQSITLIRSKDMCFTSLIAVCPLLWYTCWFINGLTLAKWLNRSEWCLAKRLVVVSVAQLVARRTHNRKVVGSISAYAVCFTVDR